MAMSVADALIDNISEWLGFKDKEHGASASGQYLHSMDFHEGDEHCSVLLEEKLTEEGFLPERK